MTMWSRPRWRLAAVLAASSFVAAGAACGSSAMGAFSAAGDFGGAGSDAAAAAPIDGKGSSPPELIVVHASNNLFPFRVCTAASSPGLPLPTTKLMPQSNVAGVEVGNAVHLGDLDLGSGDPIAAGPGVGETGLDAGGAPDGGGPTDAGAGDAAAGDATVSADAGATDAGPVSSSDATIYLVDATKPLPELSCKQLLQGRRADFVRLRLSSTDVTTLARGVALLVVSGCLPGTGTASACGADYDPVRGNLGYKVYPLSGTVSSKGLHAQFLSLAPGVTVSEVHFDTVAEPRSGQPTVLTTKPAYGSISPVNPVGVPFDTESLAAYAEQGFIVKHAKGELAQSLATIQSLSSPLTLPSEFFVFPSNYVLMLLGDPNEPVRGDPGKRLHMVAIPVQDPDTFKDGGAEVQAPPPAKDAATDTGTDG